MNEIAQRMAEIEDRRRPYGDECMLIEEDVPWLLARVRQLEQALQYYADAGIYDSNGDDLFGWNASDAEEDRGERARAALSTMPAVNPPADDPAGMQQGCNCTACQCANHAWVGGLCRECATGVHNR